MYFQIGNNMDKFDCMKSFILVAKNRSFTVAARKQGFGLAKVSKQINFLKNGYHHHFLYVLQEK